MTISTFIRVLDDNNKNWTKRWKSLKFVKNVKKKKNKVKQITKGHSGATRTEIARMMSLYWRRTKWKFRRSVFTQSRARTNSFPKGCGHTVCQTVTRCGKHKTVRPSSADVISVLSMNIYSRIFPIIVVLCRHSRRTRRLLVPTCQCLMPFATREMLTWRCRALDFCDYFFSVLSISPTTCKRPRIGK